MSSDNAGSSGMPTFSLLGRDSHPKSPRDTLNLALLIEKYRNPAAACLLLSIGVILIWVVVAPFFAVSPPTFTPTVMLEESLVIPDVLDAFEPQAELLVIFGQRPVLDGAQLPKETVANPPTARITYSGENPSGNFVLLMVDPDAPSPANPTAREWLHWLVTDASADVEITTGEGTHVVEYAKPTPPEGLHRYVFVVYKQPVDMMPITPPAERSNFNTREFAREHGLGSPVAAIYITCAASGRR